MVTVSVIEASSVIFGKINYYYYYYNSKPPWADESWVIARHKFNIWSRKFHNNPSDNNKYNILEARKHFKTSSWKCRRRYDKPKTTELMEARVHIARAYWKLLKGENKKEPSYLNADVFEIFSGESVTQTMNKIF